MSRFRLRNPFPRPSSGSSRRASAAPPVAIAFDTWLDARAAGLSTPDAARGERLTDAGRAEVADLTATFRQLDRLDRRDAPAERADAGLHARLWEDIMQATLAPAGAPSLNPDLASGQPQPQPHASTRSPRPRSIGPERSWTWTGGFARISPVLNVAMAALLVAVLGLSTWALMGTQWGNPGSGSGGPETSGLASLPALIQDGTPTGSTQSVLPTADECTITPLTVDEAIARIKGDLPTSEAIGGTPVYAIGTPPLLHKVPPSLEDLDAIAKVQREFVACTIKGDVMQVWAFYAPNSSFWQDFLQRYPPFTDEATVRASIEAIAKDNQDPEIPWLNWLGWDGVKSGDGNWIPYSLPVVNPDPQASLVGIDQMTSEGRVANISVSMIYYDPGNLTAEPQEISRAEMSKVWGYEWNEASQMWMITSVGQVHLG